MTLTYESNRISFLCQLRGRCWTAYCSVKISFHTGSLVQRTPHETDGLHIYLYFPGAYHSRLLRRRFDDTGKRAGVGALSGAAVGGIIGAAVGHPGAGAAIGGALGLGSGVLIGDQLQGQEQKRADQQRQMDSNQAELDRQRKELERLKKQSEY